MTNIFNQLTAVPPPVQKKFSVLVVEGDLDMRAYLGSLLENEYVIRFASDGRDAIRQLNNQPVDLIVSDIGIPIMAGFELLKTLRQCQGNFVPFLFLTAHSEKSELTQALFLGVDDFITKPFESEELLLRVSNLLTNTQRRKEALLQSNQLENLNVPAPQEQLSTCFRTKWLKALEAIVHAEIANPSVKVPDLAYKMALSERTFRNRIKEYTGLSPHEYMMEARMNKALYLLENGTYLTVAEVTHAVGLEYSSYFTKNFKIRFGKSPSEYL